MKTINIDDIELSLDNARLKEADNENEALKNMFENQGDKLYVLAKDIVEFGLSPFDTIAVYPSPKNKGKYIVAEGNRRVTALKLLKNPDIIEQYNHTLFIKLKKLSESYTKINEIEVLVFPNESDYQLLHWIGLKHLGVQGGKGTDNWDATQKARYNKKVSGKDQIVDFWMRLIDLSILTTEQIQEVTKTNWERLIASKATMDYLGLSKDKTDLVIPLDTIDEFRIKIRKLHKKLKGKTVKAVYDKEAIQQLLNSVELEINNEREKDKASFKDKEKSFDCKNSFLDTEESNQITNKNQVSDNKYDKSDTNNNSDKNVEKSTGQKIDIFTNSKTVIPKNFQISSDNVRLNRIIKELKELDVDTYPNGCGILLRLLFELSAKYFLEKINNQDLTKMEFDEVITKASQKLMTQNKIDKSNHASLKKEKDNLRLLFNGYAHNTDSYPSSESIKSIFKAHIKFLSACLEF